MIFATTGTQLPFDRFVEMLDTIAPSLGGEELIVQAQQGKYTPRNFALRGFISPDEFAGIMERTRLVVAHAGMGTIISSLEIQKPIVVVPRKASLGEHRSDHQMATADRLEALGYVRVAHDAARLASLIADSGLKPLRQIATDASDSLVDAILAEIK